MRHPATAILLLCIATSACRRDDAVANVASNADASRAATSPSAMTSASVGGVTLQASSVAIADLDDSVAARYRIDRGRGGILLLVTVRDAAGNGVEPGDLRLSATASALPDPPRALPLRSIQTDGMTDYIGVLQAAAPASVQFRLTATRNGARADLANTAELYPR